MRNRNIEKILYPLEVEEFLSEYFAKRPLLVKGVKDKFSFLFSVAKFKLGLDQVAEIRAVFPGLFQATIHPGDIKEMFNAGASICVTGLEDAHPRLLKLAKSIKKEINYPGTVSFRAYLSPPGSGFDLHFDARVATTLQISGRKRWWYSEDVAEEYPVQNSTRDLRLLKKQYKVPDLADLKSVLLSPGDLLCLPPGTWHRACAKEQSLSLNLAFDHGGAGVYDALSEFVRDRLSKNSEWRQPLPSVSGKPARVPEEVCRILQDRIEDLRETLLEIKECESLLRAVWLHSVESEG